MFAMIAFFGTNGKLFCGDIPFPTSDREIKRNREYILENGTYGYWFTHSECGATYTERTHWVGNPTEEQKEKLSEAVEKYYNRYNHAE